MKTLNLYVDFEFTSLSPDAQPISLGIVSDEYFDTKYQHLYKGEIDRSNCSIDHLTSKSFYSEFTDFDINRSDDWVKDNVVSKLRFDCPVFNGITLGELSNWKINSNEIEICADTTTIKEYLLKWLSQFSDYQIQFIVDCGTYDWYWLLQLIGEWEVFHHCHSLGECEVFKGIDSGKCPVRWNKEHTRAIDKIRSRIISDFHCIYKRDFRIGLPKLPSNISPVPFDLNDLIAIKKEITSKEAFELNREKLCIDNLRGMVISEKTTLEGEPINKHNALWDAKVIKEIYNKLTFPKCN